MTSNDPLTESPARTAFSQVHLPGLGFTQVGVDERPAVRA
jgi:hypothetical protein